MKYIYTRALNQSPKYEDTLVSTGKQPVHPGKQVLSTLQDLSVDDDVERTGPSIRHVVLFVLDLQQIYSVSDVM